MKTWDDYRNTVFNKDPQSEPQKAINILEQLYNLNIIDTMGYHLGEFQGKDYKIVQWQVDYVWNNEII